MSDLAEQILAHLDKIESDARNAKDNHIVLSLPRMAGKTTAKAHLDNWTPDAVLRRCAADREIVSRYRKLRAEYGDLMTGEVLHREAARRLEALIADYDTVILPALARGYGIQP